LRAGVCFLPATAWIRFDRHPGDSRMDLHTHGQKASGVPAGSHADRGAHAHAERRMSCAGQGRSAFPAELVARNRFRRSVNSHLRDIRDALQIPHARCLRVRTAGRWADEGPAHHKPGSLRAEQKIRATC
jgi:hypothetical protein